MTAGHPDDFSRGAAHVDGRIVPIDQARIPILDTGFGRSDVTYDVVAVWEGAFFRLDRHLDPFLRNCGGLRMDPGLDRTQIADVLAQMVGASGLREAFVEMVCTRGVRRQGSLLRLCDSEPMRDLLLAERRSSTWLEKSIDDVGIHYADAYVPKDPSSAPASLGDSADTASCPTVTPASTP